MIKLIGGVAFVAMVLAACTPKEETPAPDTAQTAAAPAAAALTLEALAGDYAGVTMPETGDSVIGKWVAHTNPDGTGWVVNEGSKDTVKYTTMIMGDSAIITSAPHVDADLPKGVGQVTFRLSGRLEGNDLMGPFTVSPVSKPDTVIMRARIKGSRK